MKRYLLPLLFWICAAGGVAYASVSLYPGAALIQQAPTKMDACSLSTSASGTTQQTLTVTPPSGQYVYFCSIEVTSQATAAPAASVLTHTTTNLGGLKLFGAMVATAGAVDRAYWLGSAGSMMQSSSPGVAVTIVSNAAIASITSNVQASYYFAP